MRMLLLIAFTLCNLGALAQGTRMNAEQIRVRGLPIDVFGTNTATMSAAFVQSFASIAALRVAESQVANAMDSAIVQISNVLPGKLDLAVSSYIIQGDANLKSNSIPYTAFTNGAVDASVYLMPFAISCSNIVPGSIKEAKLGDGCLTSAVLTTNSFSGIPLAYYAVSNQHIAPGAISVRTLSTTLRKISGPGTPPGAIRPFITASAPAGWIKCNGRLVPATRYLDAGGGVVVTNPYYAAVSVFGPRYTTNTLGLVYINAAPSSLGLGSLFANCTVVSQCANIPDSRGLFPKADMSSASVMPQLSSVLPLHQHAIFKTAIDYAEQGDVSSNYDFNGYMLGTPSASAYYMGVSVNPNVGALSPSSVAESSVRWGKTRDNGIYMTRSTVGAGNVAASETAPANMSVIYRIFLGQEAVAYGISD